MQEQLRLSDLSVAELESYSTDFPQLREGILAELESRRTFTLDADEQELIHALERIRIAERENDECERRRLNREARGWERKYWNACRERDDAVEGLAMLRDVWNEHMRDCPKQAKLMDVFGMDDLPTDTMSAKGDDRG